MADLQADHALFRSVDKLRQEGALLLEAAENVNTSGGRVVFSLQEIPLRRRFQTSNGNFLRRERADLVVLWAPHQSVSLKIPISNTVTTSNKDVFFWAQTQNDLLLFDDAKHLASAGAIVSEQVSGKQLEIRALTDLPIGIKYFTEHANIIQRISANEIVLGGTLAHSWRPLLARSHLSLSLSLSLPPRMCACSVGPLDKTLYVNPPASEESTYTGDTSESLPSSDDEASSFAGLESRIKESLELGIGIDELSVEQRFAPVKGGKLIDDAALLAAQKKAKLLEDDPKHVVTPLAAPAPGAQSFPRATRCVVEGHGYHMDELRFVYTYTGGIEGNSTIRWERSEGGRPFTPIPNSKLPVYRPSLEDLGAEIRVAYTPVRADGGMLWLLTCSTSLACIVLTTNSRVFALLYSSDGSNRVLEHGQDQARPRSGGRDRVEPRSQHAHVQGPDAQRSRVPEALDSPDASQAQAAQEARHHGQGLLRSTHYRRAIARARLPLCARSQQRRVLQLYRAIVLPA